MATAIDHEAKRVTAFFAHLVASLGAPASRGDTAAVAIAHVVPNTSYFLPALDSIIPLGLLLPKPKSARGLTDRQISAKYGDVAVSPLSRKWSADGKSIADTFHRKGLRGKRLVLTDIGGYYAPSLESLVEHFDGTILGVLEGTENGAVEYEAEYEARQSVPSVPVVTSARSQLKLPEDYLTGSAIVFSVESILREHAQILQTRSALVVGYGRVGRGVAAALRGRGIPTAIYDKDAIAKAEAAAQGFRVYSSEFDAFSSASLIISATGGHALTRSALSATRSGAVIATVTSRDTEFLQDANKKDALATDWVSTTLVPSSITRYDQIGADHYLWVVNDGNASNFLHGAVVGPAIQLIEAEKLAIVHSLAVEGAPALREGRVLRELDRGQRAAIAEVWNEHFITE